MVIWNSLLWDGGAGVSWFEGGRPVHRPLMAQNVNVLFLLRRYYTLAASSAGHCSVANGETRTEVSSFGHPGPVTRSDALVCSWLSGNDPLSPTGTESVGIEGS